MKNKQTAVEWLLRQIECNIAIGSNIATKQQQEQAIKLEREQIEAAFKDGITGDSMCVTSADYYNQTFNS